MLQKQMLTNKPTNIAWIHYITNRCTSFCIVTYCWTVSTSFMWMDRLQTYCFVFLHVRKPAVSSVLWLLRNKWCRHLPLYACSPQAVSTRAKFLHGSESEVDARFRVSEVWRVPASQWIGLSALGTRTEAPKTTSFPQADKGSPTVRALKIQPLLVFFGTPTRAALASQTIWVSWLCVLEGMEACFLILCTGSATKSNRDASPSPRESSSWSLLPCLELHGHPPEFHGLLNQCKTEACSLPRSDPARGRAWSRESVVQRVSDWRCTTGNPAKAPRLRLFHHNSHAMLLLHGLGQLPTLR